MDERIQQRISDSLMEDNQIGFLRFEHSRHVLVRSQELFDRLCELFTQQFRAIYYVFKNTIEPFPVTGAYTDGLTYAVACYISSWFWDLYVSNWESVKKLSFAGFVEQYKTEQLFTQDRYDPFLQHLMSVIKPTPIVGGLDDALYIPLIAETINWNSSSPFGINGFVMNEPLVQGLLDIMDCKNNNWRTVPLGRDLLGRLMWLLDWRLGEAYAWFPQEGNFTKEDLVAAHILGIPCSPRLGPRDVDDWQFFPGNFMPQGVVAKLYQRANPRRFYESAE